MKRIHTWLCSTPASIAHLFYTLAPRFKESLWKRGRKNWIVRVWEWLELNSIFCTWQGCYPHELTAVIVSCIRSAEEEYNQHCKMELEEDHEPLNFTWDGMEIWCLLRKGQSIFFKCVAHKQSSILYWMFPQPRVIWPNQIGLVIVNEKKFIKGKKFAE